MSSSGNTNRTALHRRGKSNTSDSFGDFIDSSSSAAALDHPEQVDEPKDGNGDSFIDDDEWQDADLVAGFSPQMHTSSMENYMQKPGSASQTAKVKQLDDLDWEAWETPRGGTPGPSNGKAANGQPNDDFLAAFERVSMAQRNQTERQPSPPMIDLREMEKKLEQQRKGEIQLNSADLDFFESFDKNPRAVMANSRSQSSDERALRGDQLNSMHEAQASPINIQTPLEIDRDGYFDAKASGSQEGFSPSYEKGHGGRGSWSDTAGGWAGSFRRTLGSIRGHLPSAKDFYISEEDNDDREGSSKPATSGRGTPTSGSTDKKEEHHKHPRKLADISQYSQTTPFSNHADSGSPTKQTTPLRRDSDGFSARLRPTAGHHSTAPVSGAPGFNPNAVRNWNTGSWSLSSREEVERRRNPIPVSLKGRREETQSVVEDDLAASLTAHLPKRLQLGKSWKLLYSSDQHGISLSTLYHKVETGLDLRNLRNPNTRRTSAGVADAEGWLRGASDATRAAVTGVQRVGGGLNMSDAGLILAIKDEEDHVFGFFANERLRAQTSYYGNGECFLWKQTDQGQLKTFKWTGRNDYMILTEAHYLSFGGGEGKYGLWVDGRLEQGVSSHCPAFDNEILCDGKDDSTAPQKEGQEGRFECITLEVWACGI
ncbi:TLD-domain-containing protein, partial [Meira miltonrushii]